MTQTADIVICGAEITGVSAAHFLSKAGFKNILLIDEYPPLSFTSDRSTECYRNWWLNPEMLALMNHSIDLMEAFANEGGNIFRMNRCGYLYVVGAVSGYGSCLRVELAICSPRMLPAQICHPMPKLLNYHVMMMLRIKEN